MSELVEQARVAPMQKSGEPRGRTESARSDRLTWHDLRALLVLWAAAALVYLLVGAISGFEPTEDAAMLMRYAEHLAAGDGMVWNVGQVPVDGATDFGLTVLVALVAKTGLDVESAARTLSLIAWAGIIAIVYVVARRVHGCGRGLAFLVGMTIVVSAAPVYIVNGFGTTVFALGAAGMMALSVSAYLRGTAAGRGHYLALGATWLFLGLVRPEGVLLGLFMLVALVIALGRDRRRMWKLLLVPVLVLAVLGGIYFAWRWTYFGYPLPNPFYKKGGGLYMNGLMNAAEGALLFTTPFWVLWIAGSADAKTRRYAFFTALPVVAFIAIWVLMSPEMNLAHRFQYAIVPMLAVAWPPLLASWPVRTSMARLRSWRPAGRSLVTAGTVVVVLAIVSSQVVLGMKDDLNGISTGFDQRDTAGDLMRPYADRGYTVATSEAGLIPLRSEWNALDLWGLNDTAIAHRGYLAPADLDRAAPAVIYIHQDPGGYLGARWDAMTDTTIRWARDRGYVLAVGAKRSSATVGGWFVWVEPGLPDTDRLVTDFRSRAFVGWQPATPNVK